jgi:hypothetical protein
LLLVAGRAVQDMAQVGVRADLVTYQDKLSLHKLTQLLLVLVVRQREMEKGLMEALHLLAQ